MPCYEVRTMSVEFKAAHVDLLKQAVTALGWTWNYYEASQTVTVTPNNSYQSFVLDLRAGTAVIRPDQQARLNELKRAYSMTALKRVAQLNRWTVAKTKANKGALIKGY